MTRSLVRRTLRALLRLALATGAIGLLAIGAGQLGAWSGRPPPDLGVVDGRLRPPSPTPNSVSSQADLYPDHPQRDYARIAPLRYQGDGRAALQQLAAVLTRQERTEVVRLEPDYLAARSQTPLMRFTDDLEFVLSAREGVIHLRSASRLGYGDRGVNRARIEAIRLAFAAAQAPTPSLPAHATPAPQ